MNIWCWLNENKHMADWLVAIGTLLLAFIAIFQDKIRSWAWGASLDCDIETTPPDCHRTISRTRNNETEFFSFYYRFKIWNKGSVSARNVEVLVVDFSRKDGNSFKRIEAFPTDNLRWSTIFDYVSGGAVPKRYCEYISPDTYKYCNLGHIHDPKFRASLPGENSPSLAVASGEAIFCMDVHFMSNNLYYLIGPGEYRVRIKVGAENAKTIDRSYLLKISGKWFDDETRMLNEGVSIEPI